MIAFCSSLAENPFIYRRQLQKLGGEEELKKKIEYAAIKFIDDVTLSISLAEIYVNYRYIFGWRDIADKNIQKKGLLHAGIFLAGSPKTLDLDALIEEKSRNNIWDDICQFIIAKTTKNKGDISAAINPKELLSAYDNIDLDISPELNEKIKSIPELLIKLVDRYILSSSLSTYEMRRCIAWVMYRGNMPLAKKFIKSQLDDKNNQSLVIQEVFHKGLKI